MGKINYRNKGKSTVLIFFLERMESDLVLKLRKEKENFIQQRNREKSPIRDTGAG